MVVSSPGERYGLVDPLGAPSLRRLQIAVFILGVLALIASAFGIGKDFGETLYNRGIALLLADVVCIQVWPMASRVAASRVSATPERT